MNTQHGQYRRWIAMAAVLFAIAGCVPEVASVSPQCSTFPCVPTDGGGGEGEEGYGRFLFATNFDSGTVSAYAMDNSTGALRAAGWALTGTDPGGVKAHPSGNFVYVANYNGGSISGYAIDQGTGALTPVPGSPNTTGGSNPYGVAFDATGQYAFVPHQGSNVVSAFTVNAATGELTAFPTPTFDLATGASSRSAVVKSNGQFVYLPDRTNHQIAAFRVDAGPTLSTVPGSPFNMAGGANAPEFLAIHPSGGLLFSQNPGTNTTSVFTIGATGALTELGGSPFSTGGASAMAMHPSGSFLYFANGSGVASYAIAANGTLSAIPGGTVAAGSGSQWIAVDPSGAYLYLANATDNEVARLSIDQGTGIPTFSNGYRTQQSVFGVAIARGTVPLTFTPKFAFVVNQADSELTSFTIDGTTGGLTEVSTATDPSGIFPFGAAVHPSGKFVYTANLNSQNVSGFSVDPNTGVVATLTNSPYPATSLGGANNPVSVAIDPSGKYLYAVTNNDLLYYFDINPVSGDLTLLNAGTGTGGSQPNHVTVDPTGQFVYVSNTSSGDITGFTIDPTSGDPISPVTESGVGTVLRVSAADPTGRYLFTGSQNSDITEYAIGTGGTLAFIANPTITGFSGIFGIAPAPTGTHVYMSIPSSDSVAAFSIAAAGGALNLVSNSGIASTGPQGISIEPSGRFVYSANLGTSDVTQFDVQPSGTLNPSVTVGSGGAGQPYAILTWGTFQ